MIVLVELNDLIPMEEPRDVQGLIDIFKLEGYDETKPICVEYTPQGFKILDGHRRYYAIRALESTVYNPCLNDRVPVKMGF